VDRDVEAISRNPDIGPSGPALSTNRIML